VGGRNDRLKVPETPYHQRRLFYSPKFSSSKTKKRGQRRALGEEISAENGFFYSLNVKLRGCALLRSPT
jgi:hypothetical protein